MKKTLETQREDVARSELGTEGREAAHPDAACARAPVNDRRSAGMEKLVNRHQISFTY